MYYLKFILLPGLFIFGLCEIAQVAQEKKAKLLSDFINYYNLRPNQPFKASEGYLRSVEQTDPITYNVDISFKVEDNGPKLMQCTAVVQDIGDMGIAIVNNDIHCGEIQQQATEDPGEAKETSVEADLQDTGPVKLDNEVEADTGITSGEQFIAIPRTQPTAPCIGCSSFVNPQAEGVSDLANLGVRHLDLHDPDLKHSLDSVIAVERQVQVVNGVRYILTLSINFSNCTEVVTDDCTFIKTCQVSILAKPWQVLPNGSKYRAILSNNCTEEWQFGDNGEVLPELPNNEDRNSKPGENIDNTEHEKINVKHTEEVNSQPNQEKTLSIDEIRAIEEQIIPDDHVEGYLKQNQKMHIMSSNKPDENQILTSESRRQYTDNFIGGTDSSKYVTSNLSSDKKKAIDEMLDFFNFSGLKVAPSVDESITREKRSYDYDLQLLSLTENNKAIKNSIENAMYIYEMAQKMVDYLNEMDVAVKNRAIKNVIKAQEEEDNDKRFLYIQVQVIIPCDTANCKFKGKDSETSICNGVIDSSVKNKPEILNSFCYEDSKNKDNIKEIPSYDPMLFRLSKAILLKIESESNKTNALNIEKILSTNTQLGSGRITKLSVILQHTNCNKSIPMVLRKNCSPIEQLGTSLCEVIVHELEWRKDMKITYSCTEHTADMTINKFRKYNEMTEDDPKILDMLQETLRYLELKSNRPNKQTIVNISKISTDIIAGFLVNIEFTVGYTNCTNTNYHSDHCSLLKNEHLRECNAHIWDRSWIVDGRQLDVFCDDEKDLQNDRKHIRTKRSLRFVRKRNQEKYNHFLGGESVQDPNDTKIIKLAKESMKKYLASKGISQPHRVVRIENATVQVVSGFITRIYFVMTPKAVTKNYVLNCFSKIWEQSWLHKKEIIVTCNSMKKKVERGLKGGPTEQDPSDPIYVKLADESLQKYLTSNGNEQPHKVVRITKVTTQVVAGSLTRIDFVVTPVANNGDEYNCHSEVWERPWLDKKEITVNCNVESHRDKREIYLPGGQIERDPSNPIYVKLADESMQKYLTSNGNEQPHKVVRITKVTTQVVAGSLTTIDFVVTPVANNSDEYNCHSKVWEQPWLDKKEITVNCNVESHRDKREISLPGGQTKRDPSDPIYVKLADESMQKYLTSNGNEQPHKVVRITKVTTQVVAGSLTTIDFVVTPVANNSDEYNCHSKVWERPWLDKKEITVNCNVESHRDKREISLPGGQIERDPSNPIYVKLADESMQKYLTSNGNEQPHKVVRITKVTTQVVAGSLTTIDFVVTPVANNSDEYNCHSKVWERPWLDKKEITVNCNVESRRDKREFTLLGGQTERDPSDPIYVKLADESLQKYLTSNGNEQPHKVVRITKVTTQVVAGSLTRIDFVVTPVANNGDEYNCHSEVWERPWLDKKEITVNCNVESHRDKREIYLPGGQIERDPSNPIYVKLADESMQKYLTSNGNEQPHKVVRITKVTTQVVAGSLTTIDFVVTPVANNSDEYNCHSKVWEQPWLDKKEITVNCNVESHRDKREISLPGGQTERDPSDPIYVKLADESMQKYLTSNGNEQPHKVVRITKVTTQVVAGSLTTIDFVVTPVANNSDEYNCHSKVWEQPWHDKKEITVNCNVESHRDKREIYLPGGQIERDPSNPIYVKLADESMQKYLTSNGNEQPHKVVRITKVTTQVVAGSLTTIDFVVTPVANNSDEYNCHSKVWEQPWLDKKEITVNCNVESHRDKREISLPGGQTERDPSDPIYVKLADESMQKYLTSNGNEQPHKVVRITKVTTQVVAGSLTTINFVVTPVANNSDEYNCHSKVWEQPWLDKKEITVNCNVESHRDKREISLPGGQTERDPSDPIYVKLADESMQKYLTSNGNEQPHKVVRITKVTTQVVAGSLTTIDFVVTPVANNSDEYNCHSKVWERPWLDKKEITVNCNVESHRDKREISLPGGQIERDPSNPIYVKLADESMQKYLTSNGNEQPHKVVRITKVTTQVVAGSLTTIDFVVTPVANNSDEYNCHSKVWEQPWLDKKEITVNCNVESHRDKREISLPGGQTERDPSDPIYVKLADESMQKYLTSNGNEQPHKVVRITKVTTQVVAGSLTTINFVVTPVANNSDEYNCHSKVWEQPWLDKKEITVNCNVESHRDKREIYLPGGQIERDPSNPIYVKLADESMQKYLTSNGNEQPHKVVRITKVTTQVVAGSLTTIDFVVTPVANNSDEYNCHSKVWEQPWLDKKEITVNCNVESHRDKREIYLPGGQIERDPSNPIYVKLADESMQKYLTSNGNEQPHKVVRITKVTTQVVAGSLTTIDFVVTPVANNSDEYNCHSKVWERPWLDKKEITVNCNVESHRDKREISLPGGQIERDPSNPIYVKLADESMQKYLTSNGNEQPHKVVRITKVTTQVVAGSLTTIDFVVTPVANNSDEYNCHSKVWERPWLDKKEITVNCNVESHRDKREISLPGGQIERDPSNPIYVKLADESMQKYLTSNGNEQPHKVVRITKVTTRVVAGSLTRIDFVVTPVANNGDEFNCHSEVWEQPWLGKDISVFCDRLNQRAKRESTTKSGEADTVL